MCGRHPAVGPGRFIGGGVPPLPGRKGKAEDMTAFTPFQLAGAFPFGDQPGAVGVTVIESEVILAKGSAEECVISFRDGQIDLTIPLFAFAEDLAPGLMEWALDLNFRSRETCRIARHETAPVLLLLDNFSPPRDTLHDLPAKVDHLWQIATVLRQSVPKPEEIQPVAAMVREQGFVIFRP